MATDKPMQLGMIGLGRMGANLVRRLMRDGHHCVAYDVNADVVKSLAGEGADGANSLEEFVGKLDEAAEHLDHGPGRDRGPDADDAGAAARRRRRGHRRRQLLLPRRHHPVQGAEGEGAALPRRRHQRRRVGPGARVLPDDRRGRRRGARLDPIFRTIAPGLGTVEPTPGRARRFPGVRGLPALRAVRRRALRQDGAQRHRVRHDGRDRRGAVDHQARRRGAAPGE